MHKIKNYLLVSLMALSLFTPAAEAKLALKPRVPRQSVIVGELAGIAPDKNQLNIKSSSNWFDYTILIDQDTVFIGRDGAVTTIDDFGFGDRVDARGIMDKSYTLHAKVVRDLTAWKIPVKQTTMTILNISADANILVATDGKQDWHIKIQPQTVLMDEDRAAMTIDDLAVGNTIYIAGVSDQRAGIIFASVIQLK